MNEYDKSSVEKISTVDLKSLVKLSFFQFTLEIHQIHIVWCFSTSKTVSRIFDDVLCLF